GREEAKCALNRHCHEESRRSEHRGKRRQHPRLDGKRKVAGNPGTEGDRKPAEPTRPLTFEKSERQEARARLQILRRTQGFRGVFGRAFDRSVHPSPLPWRWMLAS